MPLAIAVLLGLAGLLIVIYPLLGIDPAADLAGGEALAQVSEQEVSAKQSLRDVDFDRRLGNLDEQDYRDLRDRFEESALDAMKSRYERERALDLAIDRQLQAFSAERPSANGGAPQGSTADRASTHRASAAKTATSDARPTASASPGSAAASTDAATRRAALRKRRGV